MKDTIYEIITGMLKNPEFNDVFKFKLQNSSINKMAVNGDKRESLNSLRVGRVHQPHVSIYSTQISSSPFDFNAETLSKSVSPLLRHYTIEDAAVIPASHKNKIFVKDAFYVIHDIDPVKAADPNYKVRAKLIQKDGTSGVEFFDIPLTSLKPPYVKNIAPSIDRIELLLYPPVFIESDTTRGDVDFFSGNKISLIVSIDGVENCNAFLKEVCDLGHSSVTWGAKNAVSVESRRLLGLEKFLQEMPFEIQDMHERSVASSSCIDYLSSFGGQLGGLFLESEVQDFDPEVGYDGLRATILDLIRVSSNSVSDLSNKSLNYTLETLPTGIAPSDIQVLQLCTSLHLEQQGLLSEQNNKVMLSVTGDLAQYLSHFIHQHYREHNNSDSLKTSFGLYFDELLSRVNQQKDYLQNFSFHFASDLITIANKMNLAIERVAIQDVSKIPNFERFLVGETASAPITLYLATDINKTTALVVNIPEKQVGDFLSTMGHSLEKYYDAKGIDSTVVSFIGKTIGAYPDGNKIYDPESLINSFISLSEKETPGYLFSSISKNYPLNTIYHEIDPRFYQDVSLLVDDYGKSIPSLFVPQQETRSTVSHDTLGRTVDDKDERNR